MFGQLLAFVVTHTQDSEVVNGHLPGGASATDTVPGNIEHFTTPNGYGIFAFATLAIMLFLVTRMNIDR